jgi:TPR repeat protein
MRTLIATLTALMLFATTPVVAGDLQDGVAAFHPGDYPKAFRLYKRSAEQGNEMARDHTEEAVATLVDLMRHAKSDAARGAAAQALLDRGYGKSVAVALDVVDDGQAHLEALRELSRWDNGPEQKGLVCIAGEKDTTEAT